MNELEMLLLIIGFVIGNIACLIAISLCVVARGADERTEQMLHRGKDDT